MRRRLPHLCAALGAALACAAADASAAGAAGWVLPATTLAPVANGPSGAVVAADPAGDAVAAWTGDNGLGVQSLLAVTRPAGGAWSAPVTLAADVGVDAPSVTLDATGKATVVWVQSLSGAPFAARATRGDAASGVWAAAQDLPAVPGDVADPLTQVRADAAGTVFAAWVEHDPNTGIASVRGAVAASGAGSWSAPTTLSDPGDASVAFARPQIAPDASDGALVGWTAQRLASPFDYAIQTRQRSGSGWTAGPADLISSSDALSPLRLVGADGGDAAATWFQGAPATLWGALRTSGSWTVDHVSADVAPACVPLQGLGADAGGGATVAWRPASTDGLDSVRLTAGGWEPRTTVFASRTESAEDVAVDRGTVVLVAHDVGTNADSVLASRRAGAGWSAPALLASAAAGASLGGLDLAADTGGNALASWSATDGLGAKSVAAAAFQATGPQLGDVSVPATGTAGDVLAFSAGARSAFATVAQTTWDFGDGSPVATGAGVSHAYAQAGDYTVTVAAVDSVGNTTQATRQVSVAAPQTRSPPDTAPPGTSPPATGQPRATPRPIPTPGALVRPRIGGARNGVLVLGRGVGTLKLIVRNPNRTTLHGSATLVRPRSGRRPALTLASRRTVRFAASRRTTLTLTLSDAALRALQRATGHRLPVRLTLRLRAADGRGVTVTLAATLDATARFTSTGARPPAARMAC
ncbi:MAG TPA: PKD domain-containing protein [Conexibacter sp.]|jgi:hypothetical protein|nr:PKD domain-containing protein [Conexibacter sp.]